MDCPVCRTPLVEQEVHGVPVHFCPRCGGLLYTRPTFRQHVAALRDSPLEELPTSELFDRKAISERAIRPEGKTCPRCSQPVSPYNYAYDSNIILDRCAKCQLIWADRGEIIKVAQYVKGNPTLDRLGQALADREAERARYREMADQAELIGRGRVRVAGFWIGLLPISDEQETRTIPLVTLLLILANIAIFFLLPQSTDTFYDLGFIPDRFLAGEELHTILTSQFVHAGFLHLIMNMLFLWIFGDNVEDRFGKIAFLFAYLFFGSAAALIHALFTASPGAPAVGASGAISGVMGSYFILFPQSRVNTVIGYYVVAVPAVVFLSLWLALQLLLSLIRAPVAYGAHIGGFVTGLVVALAYKSFTRPGKKVQRKGLA